MKFGRSNIEVPPTELLTELTPEQLEAKRYSVVLREGLLEYQDDWSSKMSEAGLSTSNPNVLPFAQARSTAMNFAEQYGNAATDEEREKIMPLLEAKIVELKGPLAEALEKAIEEHVNQKELTVQEKRKKFEAAIEKAKSLATNPPREKIETVEQGVSSEKQAMTLAETAYLEEYKKFYATKGAKEKNEPEELKQLKAAYNESRISYANTLTNSAKDRLESRGFKPGFGETKKRSKEEVLERYNRLVRYKEIIKPAAEKRYNARIEAMGQRERGIFSKGLEFFGNQNKKLEGKFGKNGARFIRALSTTVLAGGVGVASGALATIGVAGLAGWGAMRIGRSLASSFLAAGAGEAVAQTYGKTFGRFLQGRSEKKLNYIGRTGGELRIEELEVYDREREAQERGADERTLDKEKMVLRALVAFGVGAGISSTLQHLPSAAPAAEEMTKLSPGEFNSKMSTQQFSDYMKPSEVQATSGAEPPVATPSPAPIEHHGPAAIHKPAVHHHSEVVPKEASAPEVQEAQILSPIHESAQPTNTESVTPQTISSADAPPVQPQVAAEAPSALANSGIEPHPAAETVETSPVHIDAAPANEIVEPVTPAPTPEALSPVQPPQIEPQTVIPEQAAPIEPIEPGIPAPTPEVIQAAPIHIDTGIEPSHPLNSGAGSAPEVLSQPAGHDDSALSSTHDAITQPVPEHPVSTVPHPEHMPDAKPETGGTSPERAQDVIVNGNSTFINKLGVPIDPKVPHAYEIKGYKDVLVVSGGTAEERLAKIDAFYSDPANFGTKTAIYSEGGILNPATGRPYLNSFHSNGEEGYIVETNLKYKHGGFLGLFTKTSPSVAPNPDSFTKIVS